MSKILFLYNNENALKLYNLLREKNANIVLFSEKIDIEYLKSDKPDFIISYTYRYIIDEEVIEFMEDKIVNLHISFLPWNRGASPNFWSFIDNTPKGVTIHLLEKGLDKGRILLQKELIFDEDIETFSSTYEKLNDEIISLFMDNWDKILMGDILPMRQEGEGSYHSVKDFNVFTEKNRIDWNMTISEYKKNIIIE